MIAYLSGTIHSLPAQRCVIVVGGVGYRVAVTQRLWQTLTIGAACELLIYTQVRDDAIDLYGFDTAGDQALFERLLTVSGVGPKLALALLSGLSAAEIQDAIGRQDAGLLATVSGVGKKTAQRIVVDLKDAAAELVLDAGSSGATSDTLQALLALGYSQAESRQALQQIDLQQSVPDQIKQALKYL